MSLYADYIKESKGNTVVEDEMGFYEYSLKEECLYVENIYIKEEFRGSKNMFNYMIQMAEIAKAYDLPCLTAVVNIHNLNANAVLSYFISYGGKVILAQNDNIYFTMGVEDALEL